MQRKVTPLNIKDPEVYRLARELAAATGESMTEVVRQSLRERLRREKHSQAENLTLEKLREIADRCASRPVLDHRSDEDIIGYDKHGVPH